MIQKSQKGILLFFLLLNNFYCSAQFFQPKNYPIDYFSWPVVAARGLSANFGELRPNHYHMGLDCRTDKKQDMQVLAASDGYITSVRVEPFGFGRSLYINHANGLTTLYAHLNDFYPELEKYVKEQQYKLKSWKVDLDIPENLFPVKKEMFIAFSGNTGSSQGPHLHFEIRDTKTDKALNPALFGLSMPDSIPPDILRLAVYDRGLSTYEQSPKFYALKKVNGIYVTTPSLIIAGTKQVSFGLSASDRYNGSSNRNGIYEALLFENNIPVIGFQLDSISYDETRYLNAHIDYKIRSSGGPYVQHLARLPGHIGGIYKPANADGVISIEDDSTHKIKIQVKDADGNSSLVEFEIKQDSDFISSPGKNLSALNNPYEFHPGYINVFENSSIRFYLPENSLYDSIRFRYSEIIPNQGFPIYQLHNTSVPVQAYFPVTIKAPASQPDKMVMRRFANGRNDYLKAEPVTIGEENGWYRAVFRDFGNFQLLIDTVPPTITPVGFKYGMNCTKKRRISFVVIDNTEEIKNFTATLDGNWLRFSNDKGRTFIYDFDEMCPAGEHELKIVAEDQVGNTKEKIYRFTR